MSGRFWIALLLVGVSTWAAAECRSIEDPRWEQPAQRAPDPARSGPGPAEGAREGASVPTTGGASHIELARVSSAQINALRAVRARLVEVAGIDPVVIVCEHASINAKAVSRGPGIPPSGLVAITTPMMAVIGTDIGMAASLLAHEFAHLVLQHGEQRQRLAQAAVHQAVRAGLEAEREQRGSGLPLAQAVFATHMAAYSRDIERQADDEGYEMFLRAGYDPRGATRLFEIVRTVKGGGETTYLATHPGFNDRISRTLALARDDSKRAAAVENASAISAENEKFRVYSDELVRNRRWRELSAHVAGWLAALPASGLAWYYRGTLLMGSEKEKTRAWEAFAKGAELDPARAEIWEALVEALLVAGYRSEAAVCVATMMATGLNTRDLRERLFDGKLFVDGRSRRVLSELWWSREPSGSRFITNDRTLLDSRGMSEGIPPDWMPLK